VQLSTDNAASDVRVVVTGGQNWTNDGTLTLNQNGAVVLHDGTSAASFQNGATFGSVGGSAGLRGGFDGTGGQYGTFFNGGTVNLSQWCLSRRRSSPRTIQLQASSTAAPAA
jgi:hypothetical protein